MKGLTMNQDVYNEGMKGKKGKSPRRQLAERLYKDPRSETYLNKTRSLKVAGYSNNVADTKGKELLGETNFTDADFAVFFSDIPQIKDNIGKVLQQIGASDKISAKQFSAMLQYLQYLAKVAGIYKQYIEKKVAIVNIGIPRQKCPECGYTMDYLKEGEE